ncbi:MAG: hypothetical protein R3323_02525 [Wenzhouxiangellaceae bacterium]|nr:hypothetical protein [Wenzhouxiangellaceae bacterium]
MIDNLSRRVRFRRWLEEISEAGTTTSYPEDDFVASDARAFLGYADDLTRKKRGNEMALTRLRRELSSRIDDAEADMDDDELLRQLDIQQRQRESAAIQSENALRRELSGLRDEITGLEKELVEARRALELEKKKLKHLLPYAYKLRVLHQRIIRDGKLTDTRREQIRELLRAGGVDVETED